IIKGTTAQPLGILNSNCLITITKDTSQTAATISLANTSNMLSRLPPASQEAPTTRWLCHSDCLAQFAQLNFTSGTTILTPGAHIYLPRGVAGPLPLLWGIPVLVMEQMSVLGTVGDLILADFQHYLLLDGGMKPNISLHAAFTTGEVILRFVLRVD